MKRLLLSGLAAIFAFGFAGIVSAHMGGSGGSGAFSGMGPGMMGGYGSGGSSYGMGPGMMGGYFGGAPSYGRGPGGTNSYGSEDSFQRFQQTTAPLRDELAAKQAQLNRELAKSHLDRNRIAALQKDIVSLQIRITKAADKAGIDTGEGW